MQCDRMEKKNLVKNLVNRISSDKNTTWKPNASNGGEWEEVNIDSPSFFHKFLCGRGGVVKKRLEQETGTLITIPRPAENKDYISESLLFGNLYANLLLQNIRCTSLFFSIR